MVYFEHTHNLIELFGFGEPHKSVQEVYENAFHCRFFALAWCTSVSGLGVVHLLYKVLLDLPVWYSLYTQSLVSMFRSDLGEPYKSVLEVYENTFSCRFFSTSW